MGVSIVAKGEVVTAYLDGEIDHHTAADLRATIDSAVEEHKPTLLVLDFKNVSFMDSSGIGTIIGRCKKMKYLNGRVKTRNMNQRIYRLFTAAGLHRIVEYDEEK